jgi:hypothetical protein
MSGHWVSHVRGEGWYVMNRDGDRVAGPFRYEYEAQMEARRRGE